MEEIDLKEIIQFFWKKKVFIVLTVIVSVALGVIYTKFGIKPKYVAAASLILTETEFKNEADVSAYSKLVDRYTTVANSKNVANKVIERLKIDTKRPELQKCITVIGSPASYCITVKVEYDNAEMCAKIADEMIKALIEEIDLIYNDKNVQILDSADVNYNPINVDMIENIMMFSIISIVLCCGCILCVYIFKDNTKKEK